MRINQDELLSVAGVLPSEGGAFLSENRQEEIRSIIERLRDVCSGGKIVVFRWDSLSEEVHSVFGAGGDEDWLVVMRNEPEYLPRWLEVMDAEENPDVYILDGCVVYVASH